MKEKFLLIKEKATNMGFKAKVACTGIGTTAIIALSSSNAFAAGETPVVPTVDWTPVGNAITSGFNDVMKVMMAVAVVTLGGFALFKLGKKGINKAI